MKQFIKKFILLISMVIFLNGTEVDCGANNYKADITAKKALEMQNNGTLLVDIRTKREFDTLHPTNSILIPAWFEKNGKRVWNNNFVNELTKALDGNIKKDVVLICRSGSRTKCVANYLTTVGFTNVYNVTKGFSYDWLPNKLPSTK